MVQESRPRGVCPSHEAPRGRRRPIDVRERHSVSPSAAATAPCGWEDWVFRPGVPRNRSFDGVSASLRPRGFLILTGNVLFRVKDVVLCAVSVDRLKRDVVLALPDVAQRDAAAPGYPSKRRPLEPELADKGPIWADIAAKHRLVERDLSKLQSAWHTDADLGREIEVVTDMTKSRLAGFHEYQPTLASFLDLFARLRREHIIPA